MSSSSTPTLRVLARGNACLCCRRRKLKCDGVKPHCGPCTRARRIDECSFEQVKVKSNTQLLQTRIKELESKLKKIRSKEQSSSTSPPPSSPSSSSHTLSPPPSETHPGSTIFTLPRTQSPSAVFSYPSVDPSILSLAGSETLDFHSLSSATWPPLTHPIAAPLPLNALADLPWLNNQNPLDVNLSLSDTSLSHILPTISPRPSWDDNVALIPMQPSQLDIDDVPSHTSQQLLRIFFQHRHQCLFQVHVDRFFNSLSLPSPHAPHPALLNAMYLLACHFSPKSSFSQYENIFLSRTRKGINHSLENADRLLNFLQASCLLAWYFFFKGRLLEGHYHASAAARFAMSCGLHLLKVKADNLTGTLTFYCPETRPTDKCIIGKPEDTVALAERINLFWSIFLADRTGAIGTGLPVVIPDNDIETPWPRDFKNYEISDLAHFDSTTLRSLYAPGTPAAYINMSDNLHAIKSKVLALNERAARLASLLECDPHTVNQDGFWKTFESIHSAIKAFQETLPPIQLDPSTPPVGSPPPSDDPLSFYDDEPSYSEYGTKCTVCPSLVLAHTAAHGAVIQLHRMFSQNDAHSYQQCLDAARGAMSIVHQITDLDQKYMPMMLGIVWTNVAETLAVEHERLQRLGQKDQVAQIERELHALFEVMKKLRAVFPILTLRISKVPIFRGCLDSLDPACTSPQYAPQPIHRSSLPMS